MKGRLRQPIQEQMSDSILMCRTESLPDARKTRARILYVALKQNSLQIFYLL
jgi:hypothetical protein